MGGATISFLNMVKGLVDLGVDPLIVVPQKRIDPLFLKRVSDYGWPIKKCFLIESVLLSWDKKTKNATNINAIRINMTSLYGGKEPYKKYNKDVRRWRICLQII